VKLLLVLLAHTAFGSSVFTLYAMLCSLHVHETPFLLEKLIY